MDRKPLWAPWRMEFLTSDKPDGCVFCALPKANDDRKNLIVHRGQRCFVILNKYPYNNGHLMIVPTRHLADFRQLDTDEGQELFALAQRSIEVLKQAYGPEGFNVGMNLGAAAGAGIRDHLHLHVVPRWNGDTNFLPVLADVKAMPQHLETSYDQLAAIFGGAR